MEETFINSGLAQENEKLRKQADCYLNALMLVYDEIFEFSPDRGTVRRLHRGKRIGNTRAYPMREATAWIGNNILSEDVGLLRAAMERFFSRQAERGGDADPFQIEFRMLSNGRIRTCIGVFLVTGEDTFLFCCCDVTAQRESEKIRREFEELRRTNAQIREVFQRFSGGMLAFKVEGGIAFPLYISENICDFFGADTEDWLRTMDRGRPVEEFLARSSFSAEDFDRLVKEGQAEVNYIDVANDAEKRIRATCTETQGAEGIVYYIMLNDITEENRTKAAFSPDSTPDPDTVRCSPDVYIRTFGYFDVFVDGKPIAFKNEKAKELFAILVDRRGGFISSNEAIGFLWEDEPASKITLSRYRKVALRLKNFLDECGIGGIVESVDGKRRIVTERVRCDLYDYLSHDPQYEHLFNGLYLLNYSWAETTLGELQSLSGQTSAAD